MGRGRSSAKPRNSQSNPIPSANRCSASIAVGGKPMAEAYGVSQKLSALDTPIPEAAQRRPMASATTKDPSSGIRVPSVPGPHPPDRVPFPRNWVPFERRREPHSPAPLSPMQGYAVCTGPDCRKVMGKSKSHFRRFPHCLFWSPKTKPIRKTLANPSVANIENIAELATAFRIQ
jgi:hypothetical protein